MAVFGRDKQRNNSGYVRRIRRPRRRAACDCTARRGEPAAVVIAPLEPTLFRPTGNLLRNPALPRHLLSRCQLGPPRPNPGPRQTRHAQPIRPAPERHLRQTSLSRLASNSQSLNPLNRKPSLTPRSNAYSGGMKFRLEPRGGDRRKGRTDVSEGLGGNAVASAGTAGLRSERREKISGPEMGRMPRRSVCDRPRFFKRFCGVGGPVAWPADRESGIRLRAGPGYRVWHSWRIVRMAERASGAGCPVGRSGVTSLFPPPFHRGCIKKLENVVSISQFGVDVAVVLILGRRRRHNRPAPIHENVCLASEPTVELTWLLSPRWSVGIMQLR